MDNARRLASGFIEISKDELPGEISKMYKLWRYLAMLIFQRLIFMKRPYTGK